MHDVLGATTSSTRSLRATARPPAGRPAAAVPRRPSRRLPPAPAAAAPADGPAWRETELHLSVAEQPWWADHAFYEQPAGWPCLEDEFPLVPMTAILEMLSTEAEALVPGSVAVAIESVRAFRWLAVEPPVWVAIRATIDPAATAARTDGATVVKAAIEGHARATVVVAPASRPRPSRWPGPSPGPSTCRSTWSTSRGAPPVPRPGVPGPAGVRHLGADGVDGRLLTKPAPGSLLDDAGQLFGFWVAQAVDKDRLVLPTSIDRISFWGPHPTPGTEVRCVVNVASRRPVGAGRPRAHRRRHRVVSHRGVGGPPLPER